MEKGEDEFAALERQWFPLFCITKIFLGTKENEESCIKKIQFWHSVIAHLKIAYLVQASKWTSFTNSCGIYHFLRIITENIFSYESSCYQFV